MLDKSMVEVVNRWMRGVVVDEETSGRREERVWGEWRLGL